jgi:hypothetical protein
MAASATAIEEFLSGPLVAWVRLRSSPIQYKNVSFSARDLRAETRNVTSI